MTGYLAKALLRRWYDEMWMKKNADLIKRRQEEIQLYIQERFEQERGEQLDAWLETSKNTESRAQPQMADVVLKAMGSPWIAVPCVANGHGQPVPFPSMPRSP